MEKYKNDVRRVFPVWAWIIYLILFAFSIPWYFSNGRGMHLIYGLPLWLICSISAVILMAIFTVWIIRKYWTD
ncbi:MAG: hypothetical protein KDC80_28770 [Saprospiraceae bacterium]|nr:hypothetical protein [Saprospiraceae bacterium]